MEAKAWWRQSDSLYNFIMQCAGMERSGRPVHVHGGLLDNDVYAEFHANSMNFNTGRLWEIDFSLYSSETPMGLEALVVEGVKAFGGFKIAMEVAEMQDRIEMEKVYIEVRRCIFGFPWRYTLERTAPDYREPKKSTTISFKNILKSENAAGALKRAMKEGKRAHIYADRGGIDSQIIISANDNRNAKPQGIFMRKSRAGMFFDMLKKEDIDRFDNVAMNTGYHFKGKEWDVELLDG